MYRLSDMMQVVEDFAPLSLQGNFDNCGLKIGNPERTITGVLVTLDTTERVVCEAMEKNCNVILEHHPSIFHSIRAIDEELPLGKTLVSAIKNDIAIYSAHTNVDWTRGGLNDCIAEKMGLLNVRCISDHTSARIGVLKNAISLHEYEKFIADVLQDTNIASVGNPNKMIRTVAVINGAGGGDTDTLLATYRAGADIFITSEVKYSVARLANELGYAIIHFGHYASEIEFIYLMRNLLQEKLAGLRVISAETCTDPYNAKR